VAGVGVAVAVAASTVSGCAAVPSGASPSPTLGEQVPGPASVWLTSEPEAPGSPVEVVMTSPDDAGIRFAHTFVAGQALRGALATSQGRYTMAALGGACSLPLVLGPDEAAAVVLTLGPGSGCTLEVVQRGRLNDPAMQGPEDAVLITNRDAGAETPVVEPRPPSDGP
jgi:hypothetical protein